MILAPDLKVVPSLYQDYGVFEKVRDEEFKDGAGGWSFKACQFEDLATAKNYIQMAREEEGVHWEWPKEIPVIWKKGPITQKDIETFPGWEELEEVD